MATPLLHIDQLTVRFGAAEVVRQVSLDIHPGEKLALVGESGSGKTVMAQAVLRLNREVSYQGRIELDGVGDVLSLSERALRGMALGRKAWLFAGSSRGGDRAAFMYSLIVTARMNDIDPQAWLADVLARTPEISLSRLPELLPWNWRQTDRKVAA